MNSRGFTLIELLVTIAVIVIMATVAVPGFQNMVADNRQAADFNQVVTALHYARSEAAKRRQEVSFDISSTDGIWKIKVSYKNQDGEEVVVMERKADDDRVELSPTGKIVFNELGRRISCFAGSDCEISVGNNPSVIVINLSGNVEKRPKS